MTRSLLCCCCWRLGGGGEVACCIMYSCAWFSCSNLLRIPFTLRTIYQIKMDKNMNPRKITNTNLLCCLSQLCWFIFSLFPFEFQPGVCTVGSAFALLVVEVVDEVLDMADEVADEATDEAADEAADEIAEEVVVSRLVPMLLVLLAMVSVALERLSVVLLTRLLAVIDGVCASTMDIRHANNKRLLIGFEKIIGIPLNTKLY